MRPFNRQRNGLSVLIVFLLTLLCAMGSAKSDGRPAPVNAQNSRNAASAKNATAEGEKRFQVNCGRCHQPPDNISPRISKTILQHMRVKAMLTKEDEEYILKYIAP